MKKHLIIIAGPTAVGKTKLSIELAKHYQTEIISADSRQFYKELSIGTAKPSLSEMEGIPHHFINNLSIHQNYNVGDYEREVIEFLNQLFLKHPVIIACGGSGMFIDAICNGLDSFENVNESIRKDIQQKYELNGLAWLQEQVKTLDPLYYSQADINNPQRLSRALEVCTNTGKPYSSFRTGLKKQRWFVCIKIMLNLNREKLYEKINLRVDDMIEAGLKEEVLELISYKNHNALNTVGYKEIIDFTEGKQDWNKTLELIKQNTRRYAKRQITWFNKDKEYQHFEPQETEKIKLFIDQILHKK